MIFTLMTSPLTMAYKRLVPVQTYESLRPYIDQQQAGQSKVLTIAPPIMYALTSGTVAQPKIIPVLEETISREQLNQQCFAYLQYQQAPNAFAGKMFGIVGAPIEGYLENGVPYGSISGLFYQNMPAIMRRKYVIPPAVFGIQDHFLKYMLCLRIAMSEPSITYLGSANPSTFLRLQSLMREHGPALIDDIRTGGFHLQGELDEHTRVEIGSCISADPRRADQLQSLLDDELLDICHVWPHVALLTTWTGGSCGLAVSQLKPFLPNSCKIMDLGYLASEMRGTFTLDCDARSGVPLLHENFYEFVEKNDWESGNVAFQLLDELEQDKEYYVFITTKSGLYRYQIDDIVCVSGQLGHTPLIYFSQKGRGITSITGEKLYESQVAMAMSQCFSEHESGLPFFVVLANQARACYECYIEAETVESQLQEQLELALSNINMEYKEKRKSERLKPLNIFALKPGTELAYREYLIEHGQREGQLKPQILAYHDAFTFCLRDYLQ